MEVEVELPARKKSKKKAEKGDEAAGEMSEGRFRVVVVEVLEGIEARLRQQAVEVSCQARAAEMMNYLLQRLTASMGAAGQGDVPVDGNWGTEDEAEKSGEETGSEEESEESGEEEEKK